MTNQIIDFDLLKERRGIENFVEALKRNLPLDLRYGKLTNDGLFGQLLNGLQKPIYNRYLETEKIIYDLYNIYIDNRFLDLYSAAYGLPNELFKNFQTKSDVVFAIQIMQKINNLLTINDYKNLLLEFGIEAEFYKVSQVLGKYIGFPYKFPIHFGLSNSKMKKLRRTYWVYIANENSTINTSGFPYKFPIKFFASQTKKLLCLRVLNFIKPEYLTFTIIEPTTKAKYNL